MNKSFWPLLAFLLAINTFIAPAASFTATKSAQAQDSARQKSTVIDTATAEKSSRSPDSSSAAAPVGFFSRAIKWVIDRANSNEGFITLAIAFITGGWWLFKTLKKRAAFHKPPNAVDTRDAKERYRDYVITAHQHLPVAGFETNLRVPIPLEMM